MKKKINNVELGRAGRESFLRIRPNPAGAVSNTREVREASTLEALI